MSKALEALERLRENLKAISLNEESQNFILLSIIEKELKAFEIIKKGCPYIELKKRKYFDDNKPYELIIGGGYDTAYIDLTQEKYDLLVEVL